MRTIYDFCFGFRSNQFHYLLFPFFISALIIVLVSCNTEEDSFEDNETIEDSSNQEDQIDDHNTPDEGVVADPTNPDDDNDGLLDIVETGTGIYINANNTGTNPLKKDTDSDGVGDWYEVTASLTNPLDATSKPNVPYPLPTPDMTGGVNTKPVKVYILSGQSNMVGFGSVFGNEAGTLETMTGTEHKFPHLLNEDGTWVENLDVYYRGVITDIGNAKLHPLMAGDKFGPELGFGIIMAYHHDEPVLILKTSQGNRSLIWDCLPPGSKRHEHNNDGNTYAGYGDPRNKWQTNTTPEPFVWYAGKQYDDYFLDESDFGCNTTWTNGTSYEKGVFVRDGNMTYSSKVTHTGSLDSKPGVGSNWNDQWKSNTVFNVTDVLDNFETEYPQWAGQGFEIAGFVWWQGHKDQNTIAASRYQENLVQFIKSLREYYSDRYPGKIKVDVPFIIGTIAFNGWDLSGTGLEVANAQLAVSGDSGNYPEFRNNVKTVETRDFWRDYGPKNQGFHYNRNAETYLLVGDAMGRAMINLLKD